MRLRAKKHTEERIEKCAYLLETNPAEKKGLWLDTFLREDGTRYDSLFLEIGCGKGSFVTGMATLHPETLFAAIECERTVIMMAMEKADRAGLKNVVFLNVDAKNIADYFAENEIDRIFLNFSDPWPKTRHAKNRLTGDTFMPSYIRLLKNRHSIFQKTDNRPLFDYSLEIYKKYNCELSELSYDLHRDISEGLDIENVVTEYEQRFVDIGTPICRVVATMPPKE